MAQGILPGRPGIMHTLPGAVSSAFHASRRSTSLRSRDDPVITLPACAWFERASAKLDFPVYALDDESAVRVRGDEADVVSGGRWLLLNAPAPSAGPAPRADQAPAPAGALPGIRAMAWSAVIGSSPRVPGALQCPPADPAAKIGGHGHCGRPLGGACRPARVTATSRRAAAGDDRAPAAPSACRQ
jgi:hypothetical protein